MAARIASSVDTDESDLLGRTIGRPFGERKMDCDTGDSFCSSTGAGDPLPGCDALREARQLPAAQVSGRRLMRLLDFDSKAVGLLDQTDFATRLLHEGQALIHTGDACRTLYVVKAGSFKVCLLDPSGSVQGLGFPMVGETIGADGLASGHYESEAVALEASEVVMISVDHMMQLSRDDPCAATLFYRMIGRELVRGQSYLHLLGSLSAEARVAAFLLELSTRRARRSRSGITLALQMKRQDIAHHLGLKVETVSRIFTAFACDGVLRLDRRRVELLDAPGLRRIARGGSPAIRPRLASRMASAALPRALAI